jgi:hypothetical protein
MDEYKEKVANVSVARGIFNDASASATMVGTPQEAVDRMMEQLADSQGISLQQNLEEATPVTTAPAKGVLTEEQENEASERFKALRNAAWCAYFSRCFVVMENGVCGIIDSRLAKEEVNWWNSLQEQLLWYHQLQE